jgi:hypothetical protein
VTKLIFLSGSERSLVEERSPCETCTVCHQDGRTAEWLGKRARGATEKAKVVVCKLHCDGRGSGKQKRRYPKGPLGGAGEPSVKDAYEEHGPRSFHTGTQEMPKCLCQALRSSPISQPLPLWRERDPSPIPPLPWRGRWALSLEIFSSCPQSISCDPLPRGYVGLPTLPYRPC